MMQAMPVSMPGSSQEHSSGTPKAAWSGMANTIAAMAARTDRDCRKSSNLVRQVSRPRYYRAVTEAAPLTRVIWTVGFLPELLIWLSEPSCER